jgi:hypothetical protein
MQWRIYYSDGSTCSDEDGPIELAPGEGVVVIAMADAEIGRELVCGKDFYYWEHGRWWDADQYGRDDYLRRPGWKKTIAGRNVPRETYRALCKRATDEPGLPPKSARSPRERPVE